jgi:hypothetical protein
LTKKANTGSEDGNRIAKHNCATSVNLGQKKEPAFRIDVPEARGERRVISFN